MHLIITFHLPNLSQTALDWQALLFYLYGTSFCWISTHRSWQHYQLLQLVQTLFPVQWRKLPARTYTNRQCCCLRKSLAPVARIALSICAPNNKSVYLYAQYPGVNPGTKNLSLWNFVSAVLTPPQKPISYIRRILYQVQGAIHPVSHRTLRCISALPAAYFPRCVATNAMRNFS